MSKNEDDKKIWAAYAKGVKQVGRRALKKLSIDPKTKPTKAPAKPGHIFKVAAETIRAPIVVTMKKGKPFHELLDRRTERQMKQGVFAIEARLDLHGKTQDEAYAALQRFITAQVKTGHRNLLIITGKGRDAKGALRTNLVNWLETFDTAKHILGLRPAAQKHGGDGAFYVILRKQK
ncbi:MAG: Smr/MutS family protein [Alphaproteobacteria bacterium]